MTRKNSGHGKFYEKTEPFFQKMESGYKGLLTRFIKVRWMAWVLVAICGGLIFLIGGNIQNEIAPLEDKSNVRLNITGPEGASYDYMIKVGEDLVAYLYDSIPERDYVFGAIPGFGGSGLNSGSIRLALTPPEARKRSQSDIAKDLQRKMSRFNNARIFPIEEQTISVGEAEVRYPYSSSFKTLTFKK
jgi:HAE1 family hydrophobic/amphiphilic exporter-1/multidrug efflux pump